MAKIKWTGEYAYIGHDGANDLRINKDEVVEVSDAKATQLLADFPDKCESGEAKPAKAKKD